VTRLAAALCLGAGLLAQQPFRSAVEGVPVDVLVTEGRAPVTGLTAQDFELRDAGVRQEIQSVSRGDVPLSVVIGFDVSRSVEGAPLEHLRAAVDTAIGTLTDSDRVALLAFNNLLALKTGSFAAPDRAAEAIADIQATGPTSVYDAAFASLLMRDPRGGRSVVLLLSDGDDTASWLDAPSVLRVARRTDAVVYSIGLKNRLETMAYRVDIAAHMALENDDTEEDASFLVRLAAATGGRVLYADRVEDLDVRLVEALRELKSRYLLTYTPRGVEGHGWHPIDVRVKRRASR
jgi:VWFA-related protein